MKADDVLILANKAIKTRRMLSFAHETMCKAKAVGDINKCKVAEIDFCRYKEQFCSIIDCITVISRDAGNEYRVEGFCRNDS